VRDIGGVSLPNLNLSTPHGIILPYSGKDSLATPHLLSLHYITFEPFFTRASRNPVVAKAFCWSDICQPTLSKPMTASRASQLLKDHEDCEELRALVLSDDVGDAMSEFRSTETPISLSEAQEAIRVVDPTNAERILTSFT